MTGRDVGPDEPTGDGVGDSGVSGPNGWARLTGPVGLVAAIAGFIIAPFLLVGPRLEALAIARLSGLGETGVAVWSAALLALDVLLPVPSSLVALGAGGLLGGRLGTAVVWVGMSAGCVLGYCVGRSARSAARRISGPAGHRSLTVFMRRWGWVSLVVLRPVPVLAEGSLLLASACGIGLRTTLAATLPANLVVAAAYAYSGAYFVGDAPLWLLLLLTFGTALALIPLMRNSAD